MAFRKNTSEEKAVVASDEKSVAIPHDYGDQGGFGFQNQTGDDMVLPFLNVLQALSPQVANDPDDGGIEGAKPGMLYNTVTDELLDGKKGVTFIPGITEHLFTEWVPRAKGGGGGGGFVGRHAVTSQVVKEAKARSTEFGRYSTDYDKDGRPAGNDLVETFYVYGVLDTEDGALPVCVAFTSTKISVYKKWMTKVSIFSKKHNVPLPAHQVHLCTVKDRNSKGEFYNVSLRPLAGDLASSLLPPDSPLLAAARQIGEMVVEGTARAAEETAGKSSATGEIGDETPF